MQQRSCCCIKGRGTENRIIGSYPHAEASRLSGSPNLVHGEGDRAFVPILPADPPRHSGTIPTTLGSSSAEQRKATWEGTGRTGRAVEQLSSVKRPAQSAISMHHPNS